MVKQAKPLIKEVNKTIQQTPTSYIPKELNYSRSAKKNKKEEKKMRLNLYKYVLMAMTVLIGFYLTRVIQQESYVYTYLLKNDYFYIEIIKDIGLQIMFSNMLVVIFCVILVIIAVVLFFGEKYFLKYIEKKRESNRLREQTENKKEENDKLL